MDPTFREFLAGELDADPRAGAVQGGVADPRRAGPRDPRRGPRRSPCSTSAPTTTSASRATPSSLEAAHRGARRVGLRDVERALHLRHAGAAPRARESDRRLPRDGGRDPLRGLLRRERRRLRAAARRRRRDRHRPAQPRLDHRRRAAVQGEALRLRERRHGRPRGQAEGGAGLPLPADRDRRRLLDGRHVAPLPEICELAEKHRATLLVDDSPRHRLHGARPAAARGSTTAWAAGSTSSPPPSARPSAGALGGCTAGSREVDRPAAPAQPALPLLELAGPGGGRGHAARARAADREHGAARPAGGEHEGASASG